MKTKTGDYPLPGIREWELDDYTEDQRSKRAFFRPYAFIIAPAVTGYVVIFICLFCNFIKLGAGWWLALVGLFVVILGAIMHAYFATPRSRLTGKPMQRYRNLSAPEGVTEVIYVDAESRTYFRKVYMVPGE